MENQGGTTDEEGKMSDGNILNDTYDITSSDMGANDNFIHHQGSINSS
jgi:hypothetical protein